MGRPDHDHGPGTYKIHEEFYRGTVSSCRTHLLEQPPRGEFVLVIAGGTKAEEAPTGDPLDAVRRLMADGVGKKKRSSKLLKLISCRKGSFIID